MQILNWIRMRNKQSTSTLDKHLFSAVGPFYRTVGYPILNSKFSTSNIISTSHNIVFTTTKVIARERKTTTTKSSSHIRTELYAVVWKCLPLSGSHRCWDMSVVTFTNLILSVITVLLYWENYFISVFDICSILHNAKSEFVLEIV